MATRPISSRSLEVYYHVDGDELERQYKEHLSSFSSWNQASHAKDWLLFEKNIGPHLAIDETSPSRGELYTIVTNKDAHGKKGCLVAIIKGVSFNTVSSILLKIPEKLRNTVTDITLDLSSSMRKIVGYCFPKATKIRDRFHVQKLALEAVQQIRVELRWQAMTEENQAIKQAKENKEKFEPQLLRNGDTNKELLLRCRYALYKSPKDWTESQKERAEILFELYPKLHEAFSLAHGLRCIYSSNSSVNSARLGLARWYNKVEKYSTEHGDNAFQTIMETIQAHTEEILAYFENRETNASAESFNSKIKAFRRQLRGVKDIEFFLYRLQSIYA